MTLIVAVSEAFIRLMMAAHCGKQQLTSDYSITCKIRENLLFSDGFELCMSRTPAVVLRDESRRVTQCC